MRSRPTSLIFSRPAVVVTLLTAVLLVAGSVGLSVISTHEISAAGRRAAHAQQTLTTLNQLLATINEAETAQRGYLLTDDEKYLAPYEGARVRYAQELAILQQAYHDDSIEGPLVRQLASLCETRFVEIARTVRLRREHGIAPALNVVESDEGWRVMNEIRIRIRTLQREQLAQISSDTLRAASEARLFQRLNGGLLALAVVLAGGVAWFVMRRLHQLEGLIKVCAWTRRVQWQGEWISFEEYLARRFNLHCTHGMSEQAAVEMAREIAQTPLPPKV